MTNTSPDSVRQHADACLRELPGDDRAFADAPTGLKNAVNALVAAVRELDARYAFDREGRPDAVTAIRHALPAVERELLDAVMDDHACELAAVQEALYRVIQAARGAARHA